MRLPERGEDTDFALGSDATAAAMRGYGLLKAVTGREGLAQLRRAVWPAQRSAGHRG